MSVCPPHFHPSFFSLFLYFCVYILFHLLFPFVSLLLFLPPTFLFYYLFLNYCFCLFYMSFSTFSLLLSFILSSILSSCLCTNAIALKVQGNFLLAKSRTEVALLNIFRSFRLRHCYHICVSRKEFSLVSVIKTRCSIFVGFESLGKN